MSMTLRPGCPLVVMIVPGASDPAGAVTASLNSVSTCGQRGTCSSACQTAARGALVVSATVTRIGANVSMRLPGKCEAASYGLRSVELTSLDSRSTGWTASAPGQSGCSEPSGASVTRTSVASGRCGASDLWSASFQLA